MAKTEHQIFEEAVLLSLLKDEKKLREVLEIKTKNLEESLQRLENFRLALLNILEDSEIARRELEKEKAKFQAAFFSIGEGLIIVDLNGVAFFVNTAAEEMLEESFENMKNKKFFEITGLGIKDWLLSGESEKTPVDKVLRERKKFIAKPQDNWFFTSKNGKKFFVALTVSPIIVNEEILGAVAAFRDITIEKEIDRMKTEFISIASHQMKTPLSAMKWFLEMLLGGDAGKLNPEQTDFLEEVYRSNERLIELVNALLNVSRIEAGRLTVEPQPTDLISLAQEALHNISIFAEKKKQNIIFELPKEKMPLVKIDSQLIYQVIINLLSNAIKYTSEKGKIELKIKLTQDDVLFEISDTGYGIPQYQQKMVFQKFFRGDNIVEKEKEGTGLGLYIIKSIIEISGGKIGFKSKENGGSTFWFTLPLVGSEPRKGEKKLEPMN